MSRRPRIVVVGSINMDLVVRVPRLPVPGETITGESLQTVPGGKGANQAVAAARLGADVAIVGCVGSDEYGSTLRDGLRVNGVDIASVRTVPGSSGLAVISVSDDAQNCITVIPGANRQVKPCDVDAVEQLVANADVLLVQLEIPVDTVERALAIAKRHGVRTVFNPAPATTVMPQSLFDVDVLCPNETEAALLVGEHNQTTDVVSNCMELASLGPKLCVVTCGDKGCVWTNGLALPKTVPPFAVTAVDSTAAGDAFIAALAVGLAEEQSVEQALRFASAAGALACTQIGAQASLPHREAVDELVRLQSGSDSGGQM